jgi:CDP-paratose 2-epimerase
MKYFITGGCGFLGSNIASEILNKGLGELFVFDNLSRSGSQQNLAWLQSIGRLSFCHGDIRLEYDVDDAIRKFQPDVVFHLAGQVAMTTSISNPRLDFDVNAGGCLNVLEAVRKYVPEAAVLYSSTNKVYGDLEWVVYDELDSRYVAREYPDGFAEDIPLDFHSPYGCSKGSADQYMQDYHRIFGLRTAVFRHSSMYGGRQFSTFDQGWVGWFCTKALEQRSDPACKPFTISGNGKQVRDLLHADDMVRLYMDAANKIDSIAGKAYNVGGGIANSLSLLELFGQLRTELGIVLRYACLPPRESDQKVFVADTSRISMLLDWRPRVDKVSGVRRMLEWVSASV